eukprot:COSAG01_NODE_11891_length_1839_cov_89.875287_1_plen_401_part_00
MAAAGGKKALDLAEFKKARAGLQAALQSPSKSSSPTAASSKVSDWLNSGGNTIGASAPPPVLTQDDPAFTPRLIKLSTWVGRVLHRDFLVYRRGRDEATMAMNLWRGVCIDLFNSGQPLLVNDFMNKLVPGMLEGGQGGNNRTLSIMLFRKQCADFGVSDASLFSMSDVQNPRTTDYVKLANCFHELKRLTWKRLARVVHRFDGTEPDDLTLIPGHIIVLKKTPVGKNWWRGYVRHDRGKRGFFPKNFVEVLPPPEDIDDAASAVSELTAWDEEGKALEQERYDRDEVVRDDVPANTPSAPRPSLQLPEGWDTAVSRSTGDTYFVNTLTGESTYEWPLEPARASAQLQAVEQAAQAAAPAAAATAAEARGGAAPQPSPAQSRPKRKSGGGGCCSKPDGGD